VPRRVMAEGMRPDIDRFSARQTTNLQMPLEADSSVQPSIVTSEDRTELADAFADELAFRAWYERSLPRVYVYLFHRCGRDPELAEELTQQAFVEALRSHRRFRGHSDAVTWVVSIARNKLVDHFRRTERDRRRLAALSARDFADTGVAPASPIGPDEIDEALALIPSQQRAVLVLHYMDQLPVRDVARFIGKSEAATASLLARGRDAFRQAYQEADR
jgi:RNA polymerase sigma-70 factor (ECF subfamily)